MGDGRVGDGRVGREQVGGGQERGGQVGEETEDENFMRPDDEGGRLSI